MVTQSLIDYIKIQLSQSTQADTIRAALLAAGWQNEDIDSGFRAVEASTTILNLEVKPSTNNSQQITNNAEGSEQKTETVKTELPAQPQAAAAPLLEVKSIEVKTEPKKSSEFPREKRLEDKVKQKNALKSALNVLFGVCLGIGLTLGLQFVLDRLFVNQPEPSPSPIIQPSPLSVSLTDIPYKNEKLGIEVLYPSGWSRNLDLEGAGSGVKSVFFESGDLANIVVEIKQIDPLNKNVSLESIFERSLAETKTRHPDFVSLGQTKYSVSGLPAYVADGGYSFQEGLSLKMKVLQAVFINESREFYVNMTLAVKEENWQDYRPVYERIIDSFKLTK